MNLAIRIISIIVIFPAVYFFIYWLPCSLLFSVLGEDIWIWNIAANIISLISAVAVSWFAWKKLGVIDNGLASNIFKGAIILGSIGFAIGFFGPIIFSPQSNQGPLLGIFITGPLGFVLGGFAGVLDWAIKKRRNQNT
jgi:hypothetical protein